MTSKYHQHIIALLKLARVRKIILAILRGNAAFGVCQSVIVTKKFTTILIPTMIVFLTLASARPQHIANQDGVGIDKEVISKVIRC